MYTNLLIRWKRRSERRGNSQKTKINNNSTITVASYAIVYLYSRFLFFKFIYCCYYVFGLIYAMISVSLCHYFHSFIFGLLIIMIWFIDFVCLVFLLFSWCCVWLGFLRLARSQYPHTLCENVYDKSTLLRRFNAKFAFLARCCDCLSWLTSPDISLCHISRFNVTHTHTYEIATVDSYTNRNIFIIEWVQIPWKYLIEQRHQQLLLFR